MQAAPPSLSSLTPSAISLSSLSLSALSLFLRGRLPLVNPPLVGRPVARCLSLTTSSHSTDFTHQERDYVRKVFVLFLKTPTNPFTRVHSTRKRAPLLRRRLRDGIEVKTCDGVQRMYRHKDKAFHCPYPRCKVKMKNSPNFQVRTWGDSNGFRPNHTMY